MILGELSFLPADYVTEKDMHSLFKQMMLGELSFLPADYVTEKVCLSKWF